MNTQVATTTTEPRQDLVAAGEQQQQVAAFGQSTGEFELAQRQAVALSKSDLVPDIYKGKPANVMIALELAHRLGASPLMVMQNLYVVKGKPSFSGQFLIALVNASPRFDRLKFEIQGTDPKDKAYRVRAHAVHVQTGEVCVGAWITWAMIDGEGWAANAKWKNMPEQMFLYRAATFWSRVFAPEISIGLMTREELEDLHGQIAGQARRREDLQTALLTADTTPAAAAKPEVAAEIAKDVKTATAAAQPEREAAGLSFAEVEGNLRAAQNRQRLDEAADLIREVADPEHRKMLNSIYSTLLADIEKTQGDLGLGAAPAP
jgi:hypothetical protein